MKTQFKLAALLLLVLVSCQAVEEPPKFDYGYVENHKYFNSFFGIELNLPKDWAIQSQEQAENLAEIGRDIAAGENEELKRTLEASEINTATLLAVFQYELGSNVEYNPGLMMVAENLKNAPEVINGKDYLYHSRKILLKSQIQYSDIDTKFQMVEIDAETFYTMNASVDFMDTTIKQKYYATVINDFSLGVVISYKNDEQRIALERIVNNMKFLSARQKI